MRDIGNALGVEAMALYRHVNGREDLLEAVVSSVLHDVTGRLDDALTRTWQGYLQTLANAIRQIALDHPGVFPLVATRHPEAPWLRPPLRSLELVEGFLCGLLERGLSDETAVHVYKVFTSFLLGHLLLEAAQQGATLAPPEEPLDEGGAEVPNQDQQLDLSDHPTIVRLAGPLRHHDADAQFERALEALLDRLDGELAQ